MTEIALKSFSTAIGEVILKIISDMDADIKLETTKYSNSSADLITTLSYKIELFQFTLPNDQHLVNSCGWLLRINKYNDIPEVLKVEVFITDTFRNLEFYNSSGEHLDAICAESNEYVLHIGTEDGDILNSRAVNNDWFPEDLKGVVNLENSITSYKKDYSGFDTQLPILKKGDRLSLQYLVAIEEKSDDLEKVDSWLAVDVFKRNIETHLGIR